MEENMSASIKIAHPDIVFVEAPLAVPFGLNLGGFQNQQQGFHAPGLDTPLQQDQLPSSISDTEVVGRRRTGLLDMPPAILARILEMVLVKMLVHCISRLDPYNPPRREDMPLADDAY